MPSVPYIWNDSHVDILLENKDDDKTVRNKQIFLFFKGIEVDGLGEKNVEKIVEAGFTTIPKILKITKSQLLSIEGFKEKMKPGMKYEGAELTAFDPMKALDISEAGSADMVLTFRNVHNWYMRNGDEGIDNAFGAFFKALKPGGVLGVVEHELPESADDEAMKKSGYMKRSYVVAAAEKAGFVLEASSDVNANPMDSADHPKGVWTLPPRLALDEQDREKYMAIGESNRMTLKFTKPKS